MVIDSKLAKIFEWSVGHVQKSYDALVSKLTGCFESHLGRHVRGLFWNQDCWRLDIKSKHSVTGLRIRLI